MKRALTIFSVVMLQASLLFAQSTMDSLQRLLKKADEDTNKVNILLELSKANFSDAPDQAIKYAEESKALSLRLNWQKGVAI